MFVRKIFVFSAIYISLGFTIIFATPANAQIGNLSSEGPGNCRSGFTHNSELALCATKQFAKPAFHSLKTRQNCKAGYKRIANSKLCVLDNKNTRVKFNDGQLTIVKASKQQCGKNFLRLPNSKACVHKRLGLTINNGKPLFVQTGKLKCDPSNPESKACKTKCSVGFFRSPELGVCVDYNAAVSSSTELSTTDCKNPLHWKKLANSGVCIPKHTLKVQSHGDTGYTLAAVIGEPSRCTGGGGFQVVNFVWEPEAEPSSPGNTLGTNNSSIALSTQQSLSVLPVISCMVRPPKPK